MFKKFGSVLLFGLLSGGLITCFLLILLPLSINTAEAKVTGNERHFSNHHHHSSPKNTIEFEQSTIIFEVNGTAKDAGVQLKLDGDPWNQVMLFNPYGKLIYDVKGKGNLQQLGLTEHFFESNEPAFGGPEAETTLEAILNMFPEGEYEVKGKTIDGSKIEGTAELSHTLPCGPVITSPVGNPDPDNTVMAWNPVTNEIDPETGECEADSSPDIDIVGYEVIVEVGENRY